MTREDRARAAWQTTSATPASHHGGADDLRRLSDVPVDVAVEMGRTRMTVGETLELRHGSIVTLNRMAGEPVDLLVNGTPIARGEVVVIDEQFGLRITDVLGQSRRPARGRVRGGGDAASRVRGVVGGGAPSIAA